MVTVGISNNQPKITIIRINFQAHLNHLTKGIRATSSTPINTPEVGVMRLVNPSPMWKAVTVACCDKPIMSDTSRNIGINKAAFAVPLVMIAFMAD